MSFEFLRRETIDLHLNNKSGTYFHNGLGWTDRTTIFISYLTSLKRNDINILAVFPIRELPGSCRYRVLLLSELWDLTERE